MLHATQPAEKKQQGFGQEGKRKQTARDQCATSVPCYCQEFGHIRGEPGKKAEGKQLHGA